MTRWADGPMCAVDTESTGVDPCTARIVSAAVILIRAEKSADGRRVVDTFSWLLNPGIAIPAEATAIHGITDDQAAGGELPADVLPTIAGILNAAKLAGAPIVGFNAVYDLTLLDHELARHGLPAVDVGHVVDPLVIDRACDKYRRGSRKLVDVCAYYGVQLGADAHGAVADAHATVRLAWKLAGRFPELVGDRPLGELHAQQVEWAAEWAANYQSYLRGRGGQPDAVIDAAWPIRRAVRQQVPV